MLYEYRLAGLSIACELPFALCITRERGQVFIELRHGNGPWHASEPLLARLGLSMQRHPTMDDGAWSGWGIAPQAQALQCHGLQLLQILQNLFSTKIHQ